MLATCCSGAETVIGGASGDRENPGEGVRDDAGWELGVAYRLMVSWLLPLLVDREPAFWSEKE